MLRRPIVALSVLLLAGVAFAHDRGVSTTEVEIAEGGKVDARFTFTAADVGNTSAADFLATGVELRADGEPCTGTVDRWEKVGDAVEAAIAFRCPKDAAAYELTLFLLSDLGPSHRNVARIAAGPRTAQAVLGPKERSIRLELPKPKAAPSSSFPMVGAAIVALFFAIVLFLRYARRPA